MSSTENRRTKMTKTLLKNSLMELMQERPFNKITVRELCENADVNRSTFCLHYADQNALLNEIESELLHQADEHLKRIDSDYGSVQYLEALLQYIMRNADVFRTLLYHQETLTFQSAFIDASFRNLKQILMLNCAPQLAAYIYDFLIMGCLSAIKKWINSGFDMSVSDIAELLFNLSDKAVSAYI